MCVHSCQISFTASLIVISIVLYQKNKLKQDKEARIYNLTPKLCSFFRKSNFILQCSDDKRHVHVTQPLVADSNPENRGYWMLVCSATAAVSIGSSVHNNCSRKKLHYGCPQVPNSSRAAISLDIRETLSELKRSLALPCERAGLNCGWLNVWMSRSS